MKGIIELSNFAVGTVCSKCTTLSENEGEGEVKVKMYGRGMAKMFNNISQNDSTVGFKVDLSQRCRARRAVSLY